MVPGFHRLFYGPMQEERVAFSEKRYAYASFSRILITLSVMTTFANISYQEIHRIIIFQIVYNRMQDFEVIFMYLVVTFQKCSKLSQPFFLKVTISSCIGL